MALDLASRLLDFRRFLDAQIRLPKAASFGKAWEVISDHSSQDGSPVWTGLSCDLADSPAAEDPACFQPVTAPHLAYVQRQIEEKRTSCNAMTHWKIASLTENIPTLYRVSLRKEKKRSHISVEHLKKWGYGNWCIVDNDLSHYMRMLHRDVLWKIFFGNEFEDSTVISLVYFFKVGDSVLGIWALHGCGDEVCSEFNRLSLNDGEILRLIKPSILCLSESAKAKLDDLAVVRWDLALLAQNSLRNSSKPMTLKEFKNIVAEGDSVSRIVPAALNLLSSSPCDEHNGLDKYYETTFEELSPALSIEKTELLFLKELFIGWQLLTRDCGIERTIKEDDIKNNEIKDKWYHQGKKILEKCFGNQLPDELIDGVHELWKLRVARERHVNQDQAHRAKPTTQLAQQFWDYSRRLVFGENAAEWEKYIENTAATAEKKESLERLPKLFFLQEE